MTTARTTRTLPDTADKPHHCFLLGAEKSATSSLHYYLAQHADICAAQPKEPPFFEAYYERGLSWYWKTYFRHWQGEGIVADARHRNLYLPYVAQRIARDIRDPRFLVCLRNPVERAYSAWWNRVNRGMEELPFGAAIRADIARIQSGVDFAGSDGPRMWAEGQVIHRETMLTSKRWRTYVDVGYYHVQLQRYLSLFPRESFKIILFDDLRRNTRQVMTDIFRFLGLKAPANLDLARRNESARRWPGAAPAPMDRATRELLVTHYAPYNKSLADLLGLDLSHWSA